MSHSLRITVWHEYRHEKQDEAVARLYPDGMHAAIRSAIEDHLGDRAVVTTATLDQDAEHGLSDDLLASTDVMVWWGHCAHDEVRDEVAAKVAQRVREGMGLLALHSAMHAKPFRWLMGTNGHIKWRDAGETERLWVVSPGHPITAGIDKDHIQLDRAEMYGEPFDIPDPDELIFISWFEGGEVFRSGCVWKRGAGRVFYFRPGHESFAIYDNDEIRRVIANGVAYIAPIPGTTPYRNSSPGIHEPMSPIAGR